MLLISKFGAVKAVTVRSLRQQEREGPEGTDKDNNGTNEESKCMDDSSIRCRGDKNNIRTCTVL